MDAELRDDDKGMSLDEHEVGVGCNGCSGVRVKT